VALFRKTNLASPAQDSVERRRDVFALALRLQTLSIVKAPSRRRRAGFGGHRSARTAAPWLVGWATLPLGFVWYGLIIPVFVPQLSLPPWVPMVGGIAWATLAFFVVKRLGTSAGRSDLHRWALVSSAILVCMVAGFAGGSSWSRIDVIGKGAMNVIAVVLLLLLGRRIVKLQRHSFGAQA
jgi:hypothetical protein